MGVAERREREREERRCQIIDAAERVFFESGAVNATMDQVAKAAELSKGTLYLYFKSKDDLFLAIGHRFMRGTVAEQAAVPVDELTGYEAFERYLRMMTERGKRHPDHMKTVLAWMATGFHADQDNPLFKDYQVVIAQLMQQVVGAVERGKQDGSIRADVDGLQTVMHVWGGSTGLWMLYFNQAEIAKRTPMPIDFEQLLPSYVERILASVRGEGH